MKDFKYKEGDIFLIPLNHRSSYRNDNNDECVSLVSSDKLVEGISFLGDDEDLENYVVKKPIVPKYLGDWFE